MPACHVYYHVMLLRGSCFFSLALSTRYLSHHITAHAYIHTWPHSHPSECKRVSSGNRLFVHYFHPKGGYHKISISSSTACLDLDDIKDGPLSTYCSSFLLVWNLRIDLLSHNLFICFAHSVRLFHHNVLALYPKKNLFFFFFLLKSRWTVFLPHQSRVEGRMQKVEGNGNGKKEKREGKKKIQLTIFSLMPRLPAIFWPWAPPNFLAPALKALSR